MKLILALVALAAANAQSPAFEVVSIKPAAPGASAVGSGGGPGTRNPASWHCQNMSLWNIIWISFKLGSEQLIAPDWTKEPRFDITAKVPAGATRDQLYPMLQNMLVERFGLKFHHDQKELQGYQLTVAKGGPKFSESGPEPPKDAAALPPPGMRPTLAADGFPEVLPGLSGVTTTSNRARGQWFRAPIQRLARELNYAVGAPVVDVTGLKGQYDMRLYWVPDMTRPDAPGPSIFSALQDQLGLKLEAKKVIVPIIVVDHAEKLPTEN